MKYQAPRGTQDVLPADSFRWQRLEAEFRELCRLYGYREIRTPTFEDTDLFIRSSGETSDIVSKQMYSFVDKGGRDITLKPEGTAPAMRALVEHSLCPPGTVQRMAYITPIFRYERPQKGRLREAHQVGIELVGSSAAAADAEVIEFTVAFYDRIGIEGVEVSINSLGRSACRDAFRAAILAHARDYLAGQPDEVRAKAEKNPLRLLDSKDPEAIEAMRDAPSVLDFLEPESKARLAELERLLGQAGVTYRVEPGIVRGLDYYTETVFEVLSAKIGAQSALCGGGRYDDLIAQLGGPPTPSVGVAMGIERALLVLEAQGGAGWRPDSPAAFLVAVETAATGTAAADLARRLARDLRAAAVACVCGLDGKSLKSQLKQADRSGARFAVIVGESELASGTATVRDLEAGEQAVVPVGEVVGHIVGATGT
ncbi:MAG: histidine--tRNA ligase [Fimbriimonadaceae bacterium]